MYCGNCLRDNALVRVLRGMGHDVLMVPMYLPLTLDERDESAGTPIFFSGISVYLEQQSSFFRSAPAWLHQMLSARWLLKLAAGRAAKTRADDLGAMTISMLEGEHGNQAREIEVLLDFLKGQPRPDVLCLSNLLLTGLARPLKRELGCTVACMMQGEDSFLDSLPDSHRELCWRKTAENAAQADVLIATSTYYADRMRSRLNLDSSKVKVVHSGISFEGYDLPTENRLRSESPVLGYFARMCPEKGLDTLVESYIRLRQRGRAGLVRLRVGGSCGPADEPFVEKLRARLRSAGFEREIEFCPNLDRPAKIRFLQSLDVFSVPARYGEAFGLYVIEAMAAGVPVVQPNTAAFPEVIEATGGGLLVPPEDPEALADAAEQLLLDRSKARELGAAGQRSVFEHFSAEAAARKTLRCYAEASVLPALGTVK